ncbi:MAG: HAD family hydrolase [Myxococcota bacterium]
MLPPPLPSQVSTLQKVLDRVTVTSVDGGPVPLVVFGVDGTFYDNRPRTLQILHEYAEVCDDDVADALASLQLDDVRYMLSQTLRRCGVHQAELVTEITSFWRERFFTELYLEWDELRPGAAAYVRRLYEAGAGIVYLSGRDIPGMLLGTLTRMRDDDFPLASARIQLVLKPDATLGDESFKRRALKEAARLGEVTAVFDSNANTCEMAHGLFPTADVSLLDAWNMDVSDDAVEAIRDFRL